MSQQKPLGRIARADAWRLICNQSIVIITMTVVLVEQVTFGKKVQDCSDRPRCTVLQVGFSLLMSVVRGRNFPGDVWRPSVPTSGLEGGVGISFLEVRARR